MNPDTFQYKIRFENLTAAEANRNAAALRKHLLDIYPDVDVNIEKDDPSTQDFGSTLVLVLSAPAIIAIANGIANFLARERATVSFENKHTKVVAVGVSGKDAARIVEVLSSGK